MGHRMRQLLPPSRPFPVTRRGLTLIEVVVSTLLVALVLVGAMRLVGASVRSQADAGRRARALALAEDLMSEVLQQSYAEPTDAPAFGPEGTEGAATNGPRTLWDDIDDYRVWSESPPQTRDGAVIADTAGFRRWVDVRQVAPTDLATALADTDDRGAKRVTVNVSYNGTTLATLVALRTRAWVDLVPSPDNGQTTGSRPPGNQPPFAVAAGTPLSGTKPLTVNFDATASTDPDGDPLVYTWDFGDGTTGAGSKPSHTFTNGGTTAITRTVTLTASDVRGAAATATALITIYP